MENPLAVLAELKEVKEKELEEASCRGDHKDLEEESVNVNLEEAHENILPLPGDPTLRLTLVKEANKTNLPLEGASTSGIGHNSPIVTVEEEKIKESAVTYSCLLQFQPFQLLSLVSKITVHIRQNGVYKKFVGYLAVLKVQALRTLCYPLLQEVIRGKELKIKDKHFIDTVEKTLLNSLIEKANGEPIPPEQEPNQPSLNLSTLASVLQTAMACQMTSYSQKASVVSTCFTNLRPVLVGMRPDVMMPRLDMADMLSFLYWPSTLISNTAKRLYTKGFHCLNPTTKTVQCLTCGKIPDLGQDTKVNVCCTLMRVLNFDGPMHKATARKYIQSTSGLFSSPTYPHLQPEIGQRLTDQSLNSSPSSDVDPFTKSGLYPTVAGTYKCYSCGVEFRNWQNSHHPILTHAAVSLHCPHILQTLGPVVIHHLRQLLLQANVVLYGYIGRHVVQYPAFRHKSDREQTWTNNSRLSSFNVDRKWSDAGYYIEPFGDSERVVCFCCGMKLINIEKHDDPWEIHFHNQENCPFVLESRPEYFGIRAGPQPLTREQRILLEPVGYHGNESTSDRLLIEGILDSVDTSSFTDTENVRYLLDDIPQDQISADILDREGILRLQEENEAIKTRLICIVCGENDRNVAFLPCGHLICCEDCAPAYTNCPLEDCQGAICGSVKAKLV